MLLCEQNHLPKIMFNMAIYCPYFLVLEPKRPNFGTYKTVLISTQTNPPVNEDMKQFFKHYSEQPIF